MLTNTFTTCRDKVAQLLSKPFFHDYRTIFVMWIVMCLILAITKSYNSDGNYRIFIGVWNHTIAELPLFDHYPEEYDDMNHYGPFFALVIAPFAWMTRYAGMFFWMLFLSMFLYVSVRKSDFTKYQQLFIFWFCSHELLNALFLQQYNVAITAGVLLTFTMIERKQDFWAAFFIMMGTFVKAYSIVGLAFFFFSKHKGKFIASLIFWAVVMFVAPMPFFHGWDYIVSQYGEWYISLANKNAENTVNIMNNISLLGMVHRVSGHWFNDLWMIVPGLVLFALPYLRISQSKNMAFRQTLLASVLMFVVLFSTGSESSGYIIPLIGVVVWYTAAPWQRNNWAIEWEILVRIIARTEISHTIYSEKRHFIEAY